MLCLSIFEVSWDLRCPFKLLLLQLLLLRVKHHWSVEARGPVAPLHSGIDLYMLYINYSSPASHRLCPSACKHFSYLNFNSTHHTPQNSVHDADFMKIWETELFKSVTVSVIKLISMYDSYLCVCLIFKKLLRSNQNVLKSYFTQTFQPCFTDSYQLWGLPVCLEGHDSDCLGRNISQLIPYLSLAVSTARKKHISLPFESAAISTTEMSTHK